jgi:hypothetical protein
VTAAELKIVLRVTISMKGAEKPNVEELEMIMVVIHFQSDSIIAQ